MVNTKQKTSFSIEVFPPKPGNDVTDIYCALAEFKKLNPDYISVTYGAGGSSKDTTVEIASALKNKYGINSIAHLTCCGATKESVTTQLDALKAEGISDILALRGDLPKDEFKPLTDFTYATDLIKFINAYGGFNLMAAAYPEGHSESASIEQDMFVMKLKTDLGVKKFISQLFFDNDDFYRMRDRMEKESICASVDAGIMPITNAKQILRIVTLSGAKLPAKLTKLVSKYENDASAFKQACLNYSVSQITELLASGVDGIHLYSMNKPEIAAYIYESVKSLL